MAIDPFEAIVEEQGPGIDIGVEGGVAAYLLIGWEMEGIDVDHADISLRPKADLAKGKQAMFVMM